MVTCFKTPVENPAFLTISSHRVALAQSRTPLGSSGHTSSARLGLAVTTVWNPRGTMEPRWTKSDLLTAWWFDHVFSPTFVKNTVVNHLPSPETGFTWLLSQQALRTASKETDCNCSFMISLAVETKTPGEKDKNIQKLCHYKYPWEMFYPMGKKVWNKAKCLNPGSILAGLS